MTTLEATKRRPNSALTSSDRFQRIRFRNPTRYSGRPRRLCLPRLYSGTMTRGGTDSSASTPTTIPSSAFTVARFTLRTSRTSKMTRKLGSDATNAANGFTWTEISIRERTMNSSRTITNRSTSTSAQSVEIAVLERGRRRRKASRTTKRLQGPRLASRG